MKILSFLPTSFSDWDGKLVSVLFLGGCNFDCPFCQNYPLLTDNDSQRVISWAAVANHLKGRKQWIDGVVVTGGEPLIHPEVPGLCREIKKLGFAVKLDTNGSFPYALMNLWQEKLLDYVAMDVKTALDERYDKACGNKVEIGLMKRSLKFLLEGKIDYELRTTLVPGLVGKNEISAIAGQVTGARRFALQQFVPENARRETYRRKKPFRKPAAEEFAALLRPGVEQVILRGKFDDE